MDTPNQSNLLNFNFYAWDSALDNKVTVAEYIWIDGTGK